MTENTQPQNASLFAKMAQVMSHMDRLPKTGHNNFHNYDYVTSEDVADAVRKAMADEKIAFFANMLNVSQAAEQSDKGKAQTRTTVEFEFTFADGDSGETWSCIWRGEALDNQDKGITKAATSAVKYFLMKTFLVSSGDEPDPDGDDTPKPGQQNKPKQVAQKQQPGNGNKPKEPASDRPYTPEVLRDKLTQAAEAYTKAGKTATEKERKVLAAQLGTLFGGDDTKRYEATKYLAGVASTKDLSDGMVKAMLEKWLGVDNFGLMPFAEAIDEAKTLTAAALKDAGQQELL